jgi:hypothetical protein
MDYQSEGVISHGRAYIAQRNYERNCREVAWGSLLLVATIAVWALFIIKVALDSGVFGPLH